jgi:hypothetical protein
MRPRTNPAAPANAPISTFTRVDFLAPFSPSSDLGTRSRSRRDVS